MGYNVAAAPLKGLEAILAGASLMKASIIDVEATIKAWRGPADGVEYQRTDESGGVIAAFTQKRWQIWN